MFISPYAVRFLAVLALSSAAQFAGGAELAGKTLDFTVDSNDWGTPAVVGDTLTFTLDYTEYAKYGVADLWNNVHVDAHAGYALTGDVETSLSGSYDFSGAIPSSLPGQASLGSTVLVSGPTGYLGSTGGYASTAATSGSGTFELGGASPSTVTLGRYGDLSLSLLVTAVSSPTGSTATIAQVSFTPASVASPVPEPGSAASMLTGLFALGLLAARRGVSGRR